MTAKIVEIKISRAFGLRDPIIKGTPLDPPEEFLESASYSY